MMASSRSGTPSPVLAEMCRMLSAGSPSTCSISSAQRSGSAAGRSILLRTGHDLEVVLNGLVAVGQGLGLNALGGVDQQHGPLAGGQRA